MSRTVSPVSGKSYGLALVSGGCRGQPFTAGLRSGLINQLGAARAAACISSMRDYGSPFPTTGLGAIRGQPGRLGCFGGLAVTMRGVVMAPP
jgi:hypothetical protein